MNNAQIQLYPWSNVLLVTLIHLSWLLEDSPEERSFNALMLGGENLLFLKKKKSGFMRITHSKNAVYISDDLKTALKVEH